MTSAIEPFRIHIDDAALADLRERLARTRLPDEVNDEQWSYGTPRAYLADLIAYWRGGFDWRAREAALNAFDQFLVPLDAAFGGNVHFVHQRSPHRDALPLIITHGWPGGFVEFERIIDPLVDPEAHGGIAADAFHVVCPSMPGYGFSDRPSRPGCDVRRVAQANVELMAKLGYQRYGAQGGDWGGVATPHMALLDPDHCVAIHLNFAMAPQPPGEMPADEVQLMVRNGTRNTDGIGYLQIQSTRPQTLGYGLNDSPAGLAAWISEKFHFWTDGNGDATNSVSRDALLTNISIYWFTQTATSSARLYYESLHSGSFGPAQAPIRTPTGVAVFPQELMLTPRRWLENHYNLTHYTEMPRGGHFAAMEEPELFVDDLRRFFRAYR